MLSPENSMKIGNTQRQLVIVCYEN